MNTSSQEAGDFPDKLDDKNTKPSSHPSTSSSSSWLRLKDPRIVRVSRAFGGKDRHSKVRTVRGLRDRRVRLSVPTAIQLYDLQDRLGLNQPSKVVDWLLNAAKDDVDELPPLHMPPLSFVSRNLEPDQPLHSTSSSKEIKTHQGADDSTRTSFWSPEGSESNNFSLKPISNSSNSLLPHHHMPNYVSSFSQWEPNSSNLPLEGVRHNMSLPASTLSLSSGPHHNYFPTATHSSQFNQFQMLMMSSGGSSQNLLPSSHLYSIGQSMRPFHFSVSAPQPLHHSQNNSEGENENQEQFQER